MSFFRIVAALLLTLACTSAATAAPRACTAKWMPGLDYIELAPRERAIDAPQLLIRRYYSSPASRALEAALVPWLKRRPQLRVEFAPGIAQPQEALTARMDYALDALDRQDLRGKRYFDWVQDAEHRYTYRRGWHYVDKDGIDRLNLAYARANGIGDAAFEGVYRSFNLDYLLMSEAPRSAMDRMVVVHGRHATSLNRVACGPDQTHAPQTIERLLRLVEYLLAR